MLKIPENFTFIRNLVIYFILYILPKFLSLTRSFTQKKFPWGSRRWFFGSFCNHMSISVYHQIIIPCCDFPSSCFPYFTLDENCFYFSLALCATFSLFPLKLQANPRIVIRRFPSTKTRAKLSWTSFFLFWDCYIGDITHIPGRN